MPQYLIGYTPENEGRQERIFLAPGDSEAIELAERGEIPEIGKPFRTDYIYKSTRGVLEITFSKIR